MPIIEIKNLTKYFGAHRVLTDINITLEQQQGVGLIGPNGSGKTTLIKCILGLVKPQQGTIHVKGQSIKENCEYRKNIGYMPQMKRYPDHMRVHELFQVFESLRPEAQSKHYDEELYREFNIALMQDKPLGELSGGMQQKVSAALAFLFDPSILILDEPTASLDPLANKTLKKKINACIKAGKLVLITSHLLNELDNITTQVIYLMEGEIQFFKNRKALQQETSADNLNDIIAQKIKN